MSCSEMCEAIKLLVSDCSEMCGDLLYCADNSEIFTVLKGQGEGLPFFQRMGHHYTCPSF